MELVEIKWKLAELKSWLRVLGIFQIVNGIVNFVIGTVSLKSAGILGIWLGSALSIWMGVVLNQAAVKAGEFFKEPAEDTLSKFIDKLGIFLKVLTVLTVISSVALWILFLTRSSFVRHHRAVYPYGF